MGYFRCINCGTPYGYNEIVSRPVPRCSCGSVIEAIGIDFPRKITMGEGNTPLVKNKTLGKDLFIKCEYTNPTGSFKDRGSVIEISQALELGKKEVVVASTGNMAASVSAYSAFAGLKCTVFISDTIKNNKLKQISAYGATIIPVIGDYTVAMNLAEDYVKIHKDAFLAGDYVYRFEGTKEIGYEVLDEIGVPEQIIVPVGNGTLFCAIFEAFKEMKKKGEISKLPKMIAVQAQGCSPIYKSMKEGTSICPVRNPETIATALICGDPIYGNLVMNVIEESGGNIVSVSDEEIKSAQETLAKNGIFVEVSGAVSYAGYRYIKELIKSKSFLDLEGDVVIIATGHGLKE